MRSHLFVVVLVLGLMSPGLMAQQWRVEPLSPMDQQYMRDQQAVIDELARRHFGRQLNGQKDNDLAIMQRLLDDGIVAAEQVETLQAMGLILGSILKAEHGLNWVGYRDQYGRSRSLQLPGVDDEFIFPVTQISRRAEVGIRVNVQTIYQELEQAVVDIRNKPPF
jgi:hypothetical protein